MLHVTISPQFHSFKVGTKFSSNSTGFLEASLLTMTAVVPKEK